jgi:uncharacterized protein (DUF2267 family)
MATSGLSVFDTTIQETNNWLNDISSEMGDSRKKVAYHALRGVLFALRDRLPFDALFDLTAQMPMLIRGIFFEGYQVKGKPVKFHKEEFFRRVGNELEPAGYHNSEVATKAVLHVLNKYISLGESEDIRAVLTTDLRELWAENI